jgi:hypothetical protein
VYLALKHGLPYVRKSQEEYETQMKERQIKALKRKARQLGLELTEKPAAVSGTAEAPQGQRALWVSLVDRALAPRGLGWYTRDQYLGNPWRTSASDGRCFSCRRG